FKNRHWEKLGVEEERVTQGVTDLFQDSRGHLLLGAPSGVLRWVAQQNRFEPVGTYRGPVQALGEDRAGTIWLIDDKGRIRELDDDHPYNAGKLAQIPQARRMLADRQGNLWVITSSRGMYRARYDTQARIATLEHFE